MRSTAQYHMSVLGKAQTPEARLCHVWAVWFNTDETISEWDWLGSEEPVMMASGAAPLTPVHEKIFTAFSVMARPILGAMLMRNQDPGTAAFGRSLVP